MNRRTRASDGARTDAERAAAIRSLEQYLAGFGLPESVWRASLARRFLRRALVLQAEQPDAGLAMLAVQAAEEAFGAWFARVLDPDGTGEHDSVLIGRAAYLSCAGPERWPEALLADAPPPDLVAALLRAMPAPVPPGEPGSMPAQPLDSWSLRGLAGAVRVGLRDTAMALARRTVPS